MKEREAKQRRAARSHRSALSSSEREAAFSMGLSDVCPRCGEDFTDPMWQVLLLVWCLSSAERV